MSGYWDLVVTLVVGIGALAWVLWQRRHPRIRAVDADELPSVPGQYPPPDDDFEPVPFDDWADQALDVIAEPDRRRAAHLNRTLRRITEEDQA